MRSSQLIRSMLGALLAVCLVGCADLRRDPAEHVVIQIEGEVPGVLTIGPVASLPMSGATVAQR